MPQLTLASRQPPSDAAAMDTTMTGVEAVAAMLPAGYRAREFRDSDREPWVEERNAQVHELQRSTADEWREAVLAADRQLAKAEMALEKLTRSGDAERFAEE